MADRTVVVRLRAEVGEFKRQLAEAAKSSDILGEALNKSLDKKQHINNLANSAAVLGAAMVAAGAMAVRSFANFDEAMSSVKAATHESAENMGLLREAALDAGERTKFSATEAAGAIENLAKAGVSTADILGGALDGALDLAAGGAMGVADAAELMASTLTQFNQTGDQASHVADLLAAGAGKAQGEVSDLGQALNQSALVANQMGLSLEETTGTLALFAKAGLIGSDAGTSFRAMLLRLANPTKEAADLMSEYGISVYDASGEFVGMESVAGQLQSRLGGLTQEQRNATLATIFGQDAIRSASILYEDGAEGVATWTENVNDAGYAAETAAIRMDNLKGDVEQLLGAFETAMIGMGEGADGPLRDVVQSVTDVVNAFSGLPPAAQGATLAIVGGGGLVLLSVAGLAKLAISIGEAKASLVALGISAKTASLAVAGVGTVLAVAAVGLTVWAQEAAEARARTEAFQDTLDEFGNTTDATLSRINDALSEDRNDWLDNLFGQDAESLIDRAERFGLAIEDLQGYILGEADAVDRVTAATRAYIEANDASVSDRNQAEHTVSELTGALDDESRALTNAEKAAVQKAEADDAAGVAADELADATAGASSAMDDQVDALTRLLDAQREQMGTVLSVRDAQRGYEASLDDAAKRMKESTEAGIALADMFDIGTEAGRQNQAALDAIAEAGRGVIDSMRENGASQEELQAAMQRTRDDFIAFATQAGISEEAANDLADELKLIPAEVPIDVRANTAAATELIEAFRLRYAGKTLGEISMDIKVNYPNLDRLQAAAATRLTAQASAWLATPGHAAGGPIRGHSSATSDPIGAPIPLSQPTGAQP